MLIVAHVFCSHGHGYSHVDLVVDQLLEGKEYSFSVQSCHPNLTPPQILSRRYDEVLFLWELTSCGGNM